MSGKKWLEYQNMTTRAKKFGGANNYQIFLIVIGSLSTIGFHSAKKWYNNYLSSKKSKKLYTVTDLPDDITKELQSDQINISLGTKFKVGDPFDIDGELSVFIEIVNDTNNPYLVKESLLKLISNYPFTKKSS